MSHKTYNKTIAIIIIAIILLSGAYFTLGGFGRSGPDVAPNLAEYGLVGYWNMEEGKGQTVYDRSGNGNNGTLGALTSVGKDDPVFTSGYSSAGAGGTGLKFDGVNDYVNARSGASLDITDNITAEAWVYTNTLILNDPIVARLYSGYYGWRWIFNNVGQMRFGKADNAGTYQEVTSNSAVVLTNVWQHLVVVKSGVNITFYKNGVSVGTASLPSSEIRLVTQNLVIGYNPNNAVYFSGSIDEVRIYNRALSADEIRQHYNQKKPILEWKFDEGSGTTVHDESFNSNDGTLHE